MNRVPEPELMDDPAQAQAYSDADFSAAHQWFADDVAATFDELRDGLGTMVDLGCGPADVTVPVARRCPLWSVLGIDGAVEMLRLARARVADAGLGERVSFQHVHLPSAPLRARRFDAAVSNSLLHHLDDPTTLWDLVAACLPTGAPIAVMDLRRPEANEEVERLVAAYAADAPDVLRSDFANSLRAAYRADEVRSQLAAAGLGHLAVTEPTDRHVLVTGRR